MLAAATVLNPLFASQAQASLPAQIIIGEVAWAGSTLSTADEWIEIWNITNSPIAVGGWSLSGMGESGKIIRLPADAVIPAYGAYLVANYPSDEAKSNLAVTAQTVTTTVSLSNSSLRIELLDAAGNLVDRAGTGGSPPAGASGTGKIPMVRTDISQDGAIPTVWSNQVLALNLKTSGDDTGTPGICDACLNPPEAAQTEDLAAEATDQSTLEAEESVAEPTETATSSFPVMNETDAATSNESAADDTLVQEDATTANDAETLTAEPVSDETQPTATGTEFTIQITAVSDSAPTQDQPSSDENGSQTVTSTSSNNSQDGSSTTGTTPLPQKPNYGMLRLNEISPAPASGKEWIEIVSLDGTNSILLKGCEIHDRQGRLMTLGAITLEPSVNPYVVIELSSARLNNDGDIVALYCESRPIDAMSYPSATKGNSWIREPDKTGAWRLTSTPTAGSKNSFPPPQAPSAQSPAAAPKPNASPASPANAVKTQAAQQSINQTPVSLPAAPKAAEDSYPTLEDLLDSAEYHEPAAGGSVATKASVDKNAIIPFTFDMLDTFDTPPIRVRLEGAVGSIPGLLPYHSFVLLSPEGRGLQVRVPAAMRLPEQNLMVSVTGNLLIDDRGRPYLKMTAKDEILLGLPAEKLAPRIVDLELPENSDAWAYVSVTGTVKSVKSRTVILELGGLELAVNFKTLVKFRPQRLLPGDTVRVAGLLDLTSEEPKILPRTADDVVLLKHAEPKQPAKTTTGPTVPGWTPFGAAAGAVALTEGTKHYRRRRQQKTLERNLEAITQIQS
jgi:hypothetical protein